MSIQSRESSEHEERLVLLPWFVNRTLEVVQRENVSMHVGRCESCQREVRFLSLLNETLRNDAQNGYHANVDVEKSLAIMMSRIDAEERRQGTMLSRVSFSSHWINNVSQFAKILGGTQWGAAAIMVLLVVVSGIQWFHSPPDSDYSVLSSSGLQSTSMRLSVIPTSAERWDQVQSAIKEEFDRLGHSIGVRKTGIGEFIVVLEGDGGIDELSEMIGDLESMELIKQVKLRPLHRYEVN